METNSKQTIKKKDVFNPVKEDKDGIIAKRMIWSTKSLKIAINGMIAGKKLVANPFYEKNTNETCYTTIYPMPKYCFSCFYYFIKQRKLL